MDNSVTTIQNTEGGFTIFTHVIPPQTAPGSFQGVSTHREPKALGTVQIMIGVMTYLLGIVSAVHFKTITGYSDISRWGSVIYISSGALSIAAANQPHSFVVRSSLVMSIISAVAAVVTIVLLSVDIALPADHRFYQDGNLYSMSHGISGVLLVFSVLEFIISIYTSAFTCKDTCTDTCCTEALAVFIISSPETHDLAEESPTEETNPVLHRVALHSKSSSL